MNFFVNSMPIEQLKGVVTASQIVLMEVMKWIAQMLHAPKINSSVETETA